MVCSAAGIPNIPFFSLFQPCLDLTTLLLGRIHSNVNYLNMDILPNVHRDCGPSVIDFVAGWLFSSLSRTAMPLLALVLTCASPIWCACAGKRRAWYAHIERAACARRPPPIRSSPAPIPPLCRRRRPGQLARVEPRGVGCRPMHMARRVARGRP